MKLAILTPDNKNSGSVNLPPQFDEQVRPDVIQRAAEALASRERQPYGANPDAGKRSVSWISKQRRAYKGCYGNGISRVPRKILSRSGTRFNWVGAFAPGCVGGRRAHPPKPWKIWERKINKKENRMAIRSALAATMKKDIVAARGHRVPQQYPFIISTDFEKITKTKNLMQALQTLGLQEELIRCATKKIRAGRGKNRGRPYKTRTGPLIVVSQNAPLLRVGLPGIDVVRVEALNAHLLAPAAPGRLTLYTEAAIERLRREQLFTNEYRPVPQASPQSQASPQAAPQAAATPKKQQERQEKREKQEKRKEK